MIHILSEQIILRIIIIRKTEMYNSYRVFFWVAHLHPHDVVQQPINGLVFVEH